MTDAEEAASPSEVPTDDPLVARLRRAAEADRRRGHQEILIENLPNITAAIAAGVDIVAILVTRRASGDPRVEELAAGFGVRVVSEEVLALLFQKTRVPDVFALAALPARRRFRAFQHTTGDLLVVDGVDGPGNLGSIIRSAAAFEAGGVIVLDQHHNDLYRRGVMRATAGTMFSLPVLTASTRDFLKFCRASATRVVTTSSHDTGDGFAAMLAMPERLALVLGSESRGCGPEVEAAADLRCRIPMSPAVESLNVSVAASVLLFARFSGVSRSARDTSPT